MAKFKTSWFCGWEECGRLESGGIIKCKTEFDMGQISVYQHKVVAPEGATASPANIVYFRNTNMFVRIHPDDWDRFEREFKIYRESRGDEFRNEDAESQIEMRPARCPKCKQEFLTGTHLCTADSTVSEICSALV